MQAHVILGLQVPGLLTQEAKDIGEVLITDLAEHLGGEADRTPPQIRTAMSSPMWPRHRPKAQLSKQAY